MNDAYHYILATRIAYDEAMSLWPSCDNRNVYNHPGCWRALQESGVRNGQIVSVEVRSAAGELAAIWPFIIKRGGIRELFLRVAEPIGSRSVDYLLPLVQTHEKQEILCCLMAGVTKVLNDCGRMNLPKLIVGETYTEACLKFSASAYVSHSDIQPSPRMYFEKSYAETEASLGWGKKHKPSTRIRRLQKEGDLNLWIAPSSDAVLDRLSVLFELHKAKWHSESKPSQFDDEKGRMLFALFAKYIPVNMLHYSELRLDDKILSCHFGFVTGDWFYWYKPAYNPVYDRFSPGVAHIALLAQHGIEHGWKGIDFLQGDDSYKYRWANNSLDVIYLVIATRKGFPWWLWETRIRVYVRRFITRPLRFVSVYLKRNMDALNASRHGQKEASKT